MRKTMQKSVVQTEVVYATVEKDENGVSLSDEKTAVIMGKPSETKVERILKGRGEESPVVVSLNHTEKKYQMSVEDFIAHAEEVETKKSENERGNE